MFTYSDRITAVTARALCERPLTEQAERIAQAGVRRLVLREKDLSCEEYTALAADMLKVCEREGITLILHSFPDAARKLGVKRIHMPLALVTEELCREFETGTSVHSAEEAVSAEKMGAVYVTAGHIYATDCKKGLAPRGTGFLEEVCRSVSIPVWAIGGITEERMPDILSAGAVGGCIMSGMMNI